MKQSTNTTDKNNLIQCKVRIRTLKSIRALLFSTQQLLQQLIKLGAFFDPRDDLAITIN